MPRDGYLLPQVSVGLVWRRGVSCSTRIAYKRCTAYGEITFMLPDKADVQLSRRPPCANLLLALQQRLSSSLHPHWPRTSGVPSCDSFLKTYSSCIGAKVPEAQRPQMNSVYDALKKNFIEVAKTADGKAKLDAVCKDTAGKMKEQLASLNCSW